MKIRCVICRIEEELSKEDLELATKVVLTNPQPKAVNYIKVLALMHGICKNGKDHIYIFHEDFNVQIADIMESNDIDKLEKLTGTRNVELWN